MATQENGDLEMKPAANGFSLANILNGGDDNLEHPTFKDQPEAEGWDEEESTAPVAHGYCVECEGVLLYSTPLHIRNETLYSHLIFPIFLSLLQFRPTCSASL